MLKVRKQKYGFTLIEVILAMAIFAIISVSFFSMFSTIYTNNYLSSVATENVYHAQDLIETSITEVKDILNDGDTPSGYPTITVQLFSGANQRDVTVYQVTQENPTGRTLESYIASVRAPSLRTPIITSGVNIAAYSSNVLVKYPNIGMSSLSVTLSESLVVDNNGLLIRYLYYWYISEPGHYVLNSPPTFPDDYQIITSYTSDTIPTIPESYAGRFLKLVVTPVGEKGKMGTSVVSNDVYISPMPINDNLMFHADASYINKDNTAEVRNATVSGKVYSYIKKWVDRSSWALDLNQTTNNLQPVVYQYTVGENENEHVLLGGLGISGVSNQGMKTSTSSSVGTKADITVYFAALFEDGFPNSTILFQSRATSGGANRFIVRTSASGQLEIVRYLGTTSAANTRTLSSSGVAFMDGEWNIFKLEIFSDRLAIQINGQDAGSLSFTNSTAVLNFVDFEVKFDYRMTLGEILVYGTDHVNNSSESNSIYEYLEAKFRP
jgi:prepilin-type N-terminal cleavage/methylation domain-containing protein